MTHLLLPKWKRNEEWGLLAQKIYFTFFDALQTVYDFVIKHIRTHSHLTVLFKYRAFAICLSCDSINQNFIMSIQKCRAPFVCCWWQNSETIFDYMLVWCFILHVSVCVLYLCTYVCVRCVLSKTNSFKRDFFELCQ